ncbi:aminopeptidase [Micromonospora sp. WMMA2032]|uniref:P1 family peptidase n=1 Tax=unclassified Micromonospora TaxID=2617518 RepID=UPI000C058480|nr:P1 family peptidase [Micromonospora sp. WMMA2032]ATO14102.1 aminopeptidase [Micromonospora sp. WMMA2032]
MRLAARRARDLGIVVGGLPTGGHNGITDVAGVSVGHTTVDDGVELHTGVTAVVPAQLGPQRWSLPAAVYTGNGYGKLVGSTQVDELGVLESPIVLTATLSVFRAADAVLTHLMRRRPDGLSFNPLVGETNDGHLSDIRRRPITEGHVLDAIDRASAGPTPEGCVGAGAGTTALGYKAGIGTSSRVVGAPDTPVTVGVLVQANFGGVLTVLGVPLPVDELVPQADRAEPPGNSCMIVVATDACLDARQLRRLARRAVFAMGRVGAAYANGSGDYAIAFSTAEPGRPAIPDAQLDPVIAAVLDSVEEAVLNSLFTATTTSGAGGRTSHAVPHQAAVRRLVDAGRIPGGRAVAGAVGRPATRPSR